MIVKLITKIIISLKHWSLQVVLDRLVGPFLILKQVDFSSKDSRAPIWASRGSFLARRSAATFPFSMTVDLLVLAFLKITFLLPFRSTSL